MHALSLHNNRLLATCPVARPATMRRAVVASAQKLGKGNLVDVLAANSELGITKKQAQNTLDTLLDTIVDTVADGGEVAIPGFGSFKSKQTAARNGRNPSTGEPLAIPASTKPTFVAGKSFKDAVKTGPASQAPPKAKAAKKTADKAAE